MAEHGRLRVCSGRVDPNLEVAAIMKKLDGDKALMFTQVGNHDVPVIGNFLACPANCEAAFGVAYTEIREFVERGLGNPIDPKPVENPPAQQVVLTEGLDLGATLPVLRHTEADGGRFITAGIVVFRDPDTGVHNASYHRLQLVGPDRTAIKLDFGRHLRLAFERCQAKGQDLPVAICIGADVSLHYVAATMGAQLPEDADELSVAGGVAGQPLAIANAVTQDVVIAADSEIVLEGKLSASETIHEGPFGEFIGLMSPPGDMPIVQISALTHRENPFYHAINGYGRETIFLRKYVMEATLLKTLRAAIPIVKDVDMPSGALHRFKAVIQIEKSSTQHEGLARNAMLAAFGALKDLDLVVVVDEDIDIQDPAEVDYALAMRFDAGRDLVVIPDARSHELVRYSRDGIRAKLGIDATRPFIEKDRYTRIEFSDTEKTSQDFDDVPEDIAARFVQ
jgi:2,5-furandicarboxylate decarboxylase 1